MLSRNLLLFASLAVTLILIPAIWYVAPRFLSRSVQPKGDAESRASVLPLLTAVTVTSGLVITVFQLLDNEKASLANEKATIANTRLAGDRDATALFVESVKLLSSASMVGRVGAIHSLGRLMERDERMHKASLNVLVAFLREQRSWSLHPACALPPVGSTPDVQAAIDVIGHREQWISSEESGALNFSELCLLGADFTGLNLAHASFQHSDLRRTTFNAAEVEEVNFAASYMDYYSLPWVGDDERSEEGYRGMKDWREEQVATLFQYAHATGAQFQGACLRGVDFSGTTIVPADDDKEPTGKQPLFSDSGISLARFHDIQGLQFKDAFKGACFVDKTKAIDLPSGSGATVCGPKDLRDVDEERLKKLGKNADRCDRAAFLGFFGEPAPVK